jgi:hypothetical protein
MEIEGERGLSGFWHRLTSGSTRNDAFMQLAQFEAQRVYRQVPLSRSYGDLATQDDISCIRPRIDDLMNRPMRFPVAETNRLLELFERRRSSTIQNVVASVSGVVGVGIGALLTALLGGG